jgi:hypothetical protein
MRSTVWGREIRELRDRVEQIERQLAAEDAKP